MANNFSRKSSVNVGTTPVTVNSYVVPSGTQTIVVGLILANVADGDVVATVTVVTSGDVATHIVKNAAIPLGGSLVVAGGEQKLVLGVGDRVNVVSNIQSSIDVTMSILEIT